jgi:hypothetical protein
VRDELTAAEHVAVPRTVDARPRGDQTIETALVRAEQPALQQRRDAMDGGRLVGSDATGITK